MRTMERRASLKRVVPLNKLSEVNCHKKVNAMNHEMKRNLSAVDKSMRILTERHAELLNKLPAQTPVKPMEETSPPRQRTVMMRATSLDLPEPVKTPFLSLPPAQYDDNHLSYTSNNDSSQHSIPQIIISSSSPELTQENEIRNKEPRSNHLSGNITPRICRSESNSPYNSESEDLESPLSSTLDLPRVCNEESPTSFLSRKYKDVMQENALILKRLSVKKRGSISTTTDLLRAKSTEDLRRLPGQSFSTNSSPRLRRKGFRNCHSLDDESVSDCSLPRIENELSVDKLNIYLNKRRSTSPALPQILTKGTWSRRPSASNLQKNNSPKRPGSVLNAACQTSAANNHLKLSSLESTEPNLKCHSTNSSPILTRKKFTKH